MSQKKHHSDFPPEDIAPLALVVGDPERAADTSKLLEDPQEVWNRREWRAFSGTYKGKKVTVCSHGVGGGGANYIFENLINAGVKTIIRAGTCGSMVKGVQAGALFIGSSAIRLDGVSQFMAPMEYPAAANHHVTHALEAAGAESGYPDLHTGIILTGGLFFGYPLVERNYQGWSDAGAVAVEMEYAPLLVQAGIYGVQAGGIFTADGNIFNDDSWEYDPNQLVVTEGKKAMLKIALEALVKLG